MYTRHVSINLRPGTLPEFKGRLKNKIVPLLRSQRGFQEQITLFSAKRDHAISISFWDDEQSANDYNHVVYLDVLRALSGSLMVCRSWKFLRTRSRRRVPAAGPA